MPAPFISYGAPPLFDDQLWIDQLFRWSQSLPKPTAILIVSAHREAAPATLSATAAAVPLVYGFGGFDARFHQMTCPTPDAAPLALRVKATIHRTEPVHQHQSRGARIMEPGSRSGSCSRSPMSRSCS